MRIFVCVKQVPDTESKLKIRADGNGIDPSGIKWVMNPYDEFAVEEAIKIKEAGKATNVTVIGLGPKARAVDALRTALAMGADDAIMIDAPEDMDPFTTSRALAKAIQAEGEFKLILTGKLAIDDNAASVSQMIAEFLSIPHATVVAKIDLTETGAMVERETEGGTREQIQVTFPAVIAANKGLNLPRYASLPGIMKAKKKTVKDLTLAGLGIELTEAKTAYVSYQLPAEKPAVKMLSGDAAAQVKELAGLLRNEAKVL